MYYLISDNRGVDYGEYATEAEAVTQGRKLADGGTYTKITKYDARPATVRTLVWSSNEHNWLGVNGQWNTNN